MLPYRVGATKISATQAAKIQARSTFNCVRCSKSISSISSTEAAALCPNHHTQCGECDKSMRRRCKTCGMLTTSLLEDAWAEALDPKALLEEKNAQSKLYAALQQFKLRFNREVNKKKRQWLIEATSHIIGMLNPKLLRMYKQAGRSKQIEVELHFLRTSTKGQHKVAWHREALEFVVTRLNGFKSSAIKNDDPNTARRTTSDIGMLSKETASNIAQKSTLSLAGKQKSSRAAKLAEKQKSKRKIADAPGAPATLSTASTEQAELDKKSPLIYVKPSTWLEQVACPHCNLDMRLSNFSKHFAIHHCLPIVCLEMNDTRQIWLDPHVALSRSLYPHTLFLLKNVVRDLGGSEYRNLYPVVLMTAAFKKSEISTGTKKSTINESKCLMLWLSGICINKEIQVCLKVKSKRTGTMSQCSTLDKLYPITQPQRIADIYQSGETLILPPEVHSALSKNGVENILLEISVSDDKEL